MLQSSEARAVVTIDWFRADVETARAEAPDVRHLLTPDALETGTAVAASVRASEDTSASPVHVRQHVRAPRRRAEPQQRDGTVRMMVEAVGVTPTDWLVSWLPLPRHGADRPRLRGALHGARLALLPPDLGILPWLEAITEHRARSRCPRTSATELRPARARHRGPRPLEPRMALSARSRCGSRRPRVPGALRRGDIFAPATGWPRRRSPWRSGPTVNRCAPTRREASSRWAALPGVRVEIAPDGAGGAPGEWARSSSRAPA